MFTAMKSAMMKIRPREGNRSREIDAKPIKSCALSPNNPSAISFRFILPAGTKKNNQ